ncbi:MAG TPA: NUDIX hydrolase [Fibrobacteres bacterium]|jgi:isopentenyldiphosphate isomerase|nr:NUDIX hydrolase [Fibrobacterota bacterium]
MAPQTDPEELLTRVSDDDATVIGPVARRQVHGHPDIIHRAVHIIVLNDEGLMLLQKRAADKDIMPGRWDTSVGGHVGFGQTYEEAALREAEEELGVRLKSDMLEDLYLLKIRDPVESENIRTYFCHHSGPFQPDPSEVESVRFWSRAEIEAALGTHIFTPNFESEYTAFIACPRGNLLR